MQAKSENHPYVMAKVLNRRGVVFWTFHPGNTDLNVAEFPDDSWNVIVENVRRVPMFVRVLVDGVPIPIVPDVPDGAVNLMPRFRWAITKSLRKAKGDITVQVYVLREEEGEGAHIFRPEIPEEPTLVIRIPYRTE